MGAGHASTAIGYAVGLKEAMRRGAGEDGKVVAVVGDGAMTGGVAFEAVHQAGGLGTPLVVILNDNGMSIAPNVGAPQPLLQPRPARAPALEGARGRRGEAHAAAGRHRRARSSASARSSRSRSRRCGSPASGGRSSTGPTWASSTATTCAPCATRCAPPSRPSGPSSIHVATVKGKGFAPAEDGGLEGMEKWHAAKPNSIADRAPAPPSRKHEERRARRSTRRCSARRWCASASATSASSASPRR